jgi:hypothetical protein
MPENNIKEEVGNLINKHDPAQLFQYGAPEDEYKKEIQIVYIFLMNNPKISVTDIRDGIKSIFTNRFSFTTVQNFSKIYDDLAFDLNNLLRQQNGDR